MIRVLKNEKGIALITTLLLLVLGFAVVVTLLRLVTAETKMSRMEQSYQTALDTAKGGADLFISMKQQYTGSGVFQQPLGSNPVSPLCLQVKLNNPTASWDANWPGGVGCPTVASGNATNADPTQHADITLSLSNYNVSIKVIDTWFSSATNCGSNCPCNNGCYYYTVSVRSVAPDSNENANIYFIYRYDN